MPSLSVVVVPLYSQLPPECKSHVLSFLCLENVAQFASASLGAMKASLPDLQRRRESMKKSFAYAPAWKTPRKVELLGPWDVLTKHHPTVFDWIKLPSIHQRLSDLHKIVPSGHPMKEAIFKASRDLARDIVLDCHDLACLDFTHIFAQYQELLFVQKIYASIVRYILHVNPMEKASEVSLARYMGDVLCAANLTGPMVLRSGHHQPNSHYQSWVSLHSSILRTKSFTPAQRNRWGVPHYTGLSERIALDISVDENFMSSEMKLVFREFGPLGPAFRGRDIVRLRGISGRCLLSYLVNDAENQAVNPTGTFNAWEWICEVHEQSLRSRPMTVRPPHIRLAVRN